jgi:hypothetical protein
MKNCKKSYSNSPHLVQVQIQANREETISIHADRAPCTSELDATPPVSHCRASETLDPTAQQNRKLFSFMRNRQEGESVECTTDGG